MRRPCPQAHPHVCGEHAGGNGGADNQFGSSPRMRGTPPMSRPSSLPARLIPTYAGNTVSAGNAAAGCAAHPHVCGEHIRMPSANGPQIGSSPRMRGTLQQVKVGFLIVRLIPTYAGNTNRYRTGIASSSAHPHVCGEHPTTCVSTPPSSGSSPRMRGTPSADYGDVGGHGLIPTYAGNTCAAG